MKLRIPDNIKNITPYPPGKPLDELEREYGVTDSIKLASNENPLGPSPLAVRAMKRSLEGVHRYPDGSGYYLTRALADHLNVEADQLVLGNGSNEIIEFLVKAFVREGDEVVTSHPSFLMYQKFVQIRGGVNRVLPLKEMHHDLEAVLEAVTEKTKLIFIDDPNNPTGTYINKEKLARFLDSVPESVIVVLDQAYVDFMEPDLVTPVESLIARKEGRCSTVLLRTFSKAYGLSGLRVGFGLMAKEVAQCLHKVRQPFNINSLGQIGSLAALGDTEYFAETIRATRTGMRYLMGRLETMGCTCYPSQTNFFLIDVSREADPLYEAMLYKGVIVRSMRAYGFPTFIRLTVGTDEENERFLKALSEVMEELGND